MTETTLYFNVPEGFHVVEGATTAPNGYKWIARGSFFDGSREHGLIAVHNIENPSRREPARLAM